LAFAIERIRFARNYTQSLLKDIDDGQWFAAIGPQGGNPGGSTAEGDAAGPTHVAWQVGHLASAQYSLCLARIRGPQPEDEQLIPADFREHFRKGSTPHAGPAGYPSPREIREVAAAVHARALEELPQLQEGLLDQPIENPHPAFGTRYGALVFCPEHEFLHAGQIGLIRRLLDKPPLR
jgi:hypothetical protein